MTSTPVSGDVKNVVMNMASPSASKGKAENNFSDVLQKQSQTSETEPAETKAASTPRTKVENQGTKVKEEQEVTPVQAGKEETPEVSEEQMLEAAEALAGQLMEQLAQQLGISVEEVNSLLEDMGMTALDLLQPDNLMQVLLAAGGEQDSLSLLTNEKLYASFQTLNETLQTGLQQIAETTGMEVPEIRQLLEQASVEQMQPAEQDQMMQKLPDESSHVQDKQPQENTGIADRMGITAENEGSRIMMERSQQTGAHQETGHQQTSGEQNSFAQVMTNQQPVNAVENAIPEQQYFSADTHQIMNQIMDFMKVHVGDGLSQLEMQLHPESLGTLHVNIASKEGVVTAQFTAQNEAVKAALEGQMIQLKETFQEQGVKVEAIEVTVQSHAFEQNLEQGRQGTQEGGQKGNGRGRIRRLNLEGMEGIPEEELNDADRLATEMMAQNGNTVDYTA